MHLREIITASIREFLKENKNYSSNVKITSIGNEEDEREELNKKLNIINKYFPFNSVSGEYNSENGVELYFDNDIRIYGQFNEEPFDVNMVIDNNNYVVDIHPFDGMGGFNAILFDKYIKEIHKEENSISLVIAHEGYAVKSISFNKNELGNYKTYLVEGTQIEGKTLGKTQNGEKPFREKN